MKLRTTSLAALAAFTIAGSASAAGVWSTIDWTGDSSLSFITSTNVTHSGDVGSTATVNGFTFEQFSTAGTNYTVGSTKALSYAAAPFEIVAGTASSLLSDGLAYMDYGQPEPAPVNGTTVTFNLTGLTANTNYVFSFLSHAWVQSPDGALRTGTLDGSDDGTGNTLAIDQSDGTAAKIYQYAYNTGNSTSFTMTMTNTSATDNVGIHTYAFTNTIPEPSAALLGGLGMLALLRRRRA